MRKPRDPQTTPSLTDSPHEAGDPPDYSISQESGPLGTYHRGGTFYVLRLTQRTVVSRPARKIFGPWREGHVAGKAAGSRSLAQPADGRARNRCAARTPLQAYGHSKRTRLSPAGNSQCRGSPDQPGRLSGSQSAPRPTSIERTRMRECDNPQRRRPESCSRVARNLTKLSKVG